MSVEAILMHFETNFAYEIRVVRGVRRISPEKFFKIKMSVEAILMHFETTNFACEIRLIVQAFNLAVFKRVSTATTTKE